MGRVFISYRRGDTEGQARSLARDIENALGENSVFMDVDSIAPGLDFREVLAERLNGCELMLAVIGPNWLDPRKDGTPGPSEFVQFEIAAALKRKIPIAPVLVRGAQMPAPEQLPETIKDLVFRNGFEVSHTRWDSDVNEMLRRLDLHEETAAPEAPDLHEETAAPEPPKSGAGWKKIAIGAVGATILLGGIGSMLGPAQGPAPPSTVEGEPSSAGTPAEPAPESPVSAGDRWVVLPPGNVFDSQWDAGCLAARRGICWVRQLKSQLYKPDAYEIDRNPQTGFRGIPPGGSVGIQANNGSNEDNPVRMVLLDANGGVDAVLHEYGHIAAYSQSQMLYVDITGHYGVYITSQQTAEGASASWDHTGPATVAQLAELGIAR
jgi:TIR domain